MKCVVVGDALLDVDLDGAVSRVAPDAPVPVVDDIDAYFRPGGAALAATLLAADGCDTTLMTALGRDPSSVSLLQLLESFGVEVIDIGRSGSTPRKVRVRAGGQCIARLDFGRGAVEISEEDAAAAVRRTTPSLPVLVADYGRGVARSAALRGMCEQSRHVVWDPHPLGADPVVGAQLVTPNASEAARFCGRPADRSPAPPDATDTAMELRERWRAHAVAVTCGARGAVVASGDPVPFVVPVVRPVTGDACGAGDRFASAALRALAGGAVPTEAVHVAVAACETFLARGGASTFSVRDGHDDRANARLVATSGCFDVLHSGHVSALRAARALGDRLVVCLNSDASVRRLKGADRPVMPVAARELMLRALECVDDVVVFDEDTPVTVLERLRPDVFVKGGDYDAASLPEAAALARWGGRAVVVPYLDGHSTTDILEELRRAQP